MWERRKEKKGVFEQEGGRNYVPEREGGEKGVKVVCLCFSGYKYMEGYTCFGCSVCEHV